tara:strand:- start:6481 stop:8028 length:1548 start_codon:yes stop_codon:yes gene_type:complete
MVARRKTRQQITESREHYENYIKKYRGEVGSAYREEENKERVLRRVAKGSVPNVDSMSRYDITLEDINQVRKINNLDPVIMNIPMFLQSRMYRDGADGREAEGDFVPDVSEVRDEYVPRVDEEVEQRVPLAEVQQQANREFTGALDAMSISRWIRSNPRQATAKRFGTVSKQTTNNQFGSPNSDKTGYFYNFLKYLGQKYVDDVSLVLRKDAPKYIREMINKPRRNLRKDSQNIFKNLQTTNNEYSTVLIALREYPRFKEDFANDQRFKDAYKELDRIFTETDAKIAANKLQNPKDPKPVVDWNTLVNKVKNKYNDRLSKEFLYIDMYNEFPSRDDFSALFVDASTNQVPQKDNQAQISSINKNTLFLPNNSTRKNMKKALLVLVDYKTKSLYGTKEYQFSEALTKRMVKYWEKNNSPVYFFGKPKMTSWVGKLLDSLGITDRGGSNISYLRRSYISTAMKQVTSAAEREQLSFKLRHSPSASLKYIRELEDISELNTGAIELARGNKLGLQRKE